MREKNLRSSYYDERAIVGWGATIRELVEFPENRRPERIGSRGARCQAFVDSLGAEDVAVTVDGFGHAIGEDHDLIAASPIDDEFRV